MGDKIFPTLGRQIPQLNSTKWGLFIYVEMVKNSIHYCKSQHIVCTNLCFDVGNMLFVSLAVMQCTSLYIVLNWDSMRKK